MTAFNYGKKVFFIVLVPDAGTECPEGLRRNEASEEESDFVLKC